MKVLLINGSASGVVAHFLDRAFFSTFLGGRNKEGMQNMRIPTRNMAYHLKCKEAAAKAGIVPPKAEKIEFTNFIR